MVFKELPVGNIFKTDQGLFIKVLEPRTENALACRGYGLLALRRLVQIRKRVEDFVMEQEEKLDSVSHIHWGTIISPPHRSNLYLITNGLSPKGIIVAILGPYLEASDRWPIKDLGYAGEYIGIQEV